MARVAPQRGPAAIDTRRRVLLRAWHRKLAADARHISPALGADAVHHARVGARRLRMVLKAIGKECQPILLPTLLFDLRDLGRALAPVRDADVRRDHVATLLRHRPREFRMEIIHLLARMDATQVTARRSLKTMMSEPAWNLRLQRLAAHLADDSLLALPRADRALPEQQALHRYARNIRKKLRRLDDAKLDLHALRIKVKHARYLSDFLTSLKPAPPDAHLADLRRLQTHLGELHDHLQLESWLATTTGLSRGLRKLLQERLRAAIAEQRTQLEKLRDVKL